MASDFDKYYKFYADQASGSSYARVEPLRRQRGRGLGDLLAGLFRRVLPFISGGIKTIGGEVLDTTIGLFKDHIQGKNMSSSVDERLSSAGSRLGDKAATSLKGMVGLGIKRQRKGARGQSSKSSGSKTVGKRKSRSSSSTGGGAKRRKKKAPSRKKKAPRKKSTPGKRKDIFGGY